MSPLGKITIIKTNMVSQCVHLMSTLPTSDSFLKEVNTILYNFLWEGKPDKIKRSTTILKHTHGGLKMVNIYNFDKSLKVTWVKKLLTQSEILSGASLLAQYLKELT